MRGLALLALALVPACGGADRNGPVANTAGVLEVVLTSGTSTDGAVQFLVQGGPVDSVEAAGYYTVHAPYSGVAEQVIVTGTLSDGVLVRVHVPDVRTVYTAVVLEAADRISFALQPLAGYRLAVRPAP